MTITDKESFKKWIEARDSGNLQEETMILANRAASRAFPFVCQWFRQKHIQKTDLEAAPVARTLLNTSIAFKLASGLFGSAVGETDRITSIAGNEVKTAKPDSTERDLAFAAEKGSYAAATTDELMHEIFGNPIASNRTYHAAVGCADRAASAVGGAKKQFWGALEIDIAETEIRGADAIREMPLWPVGVPLHPDVRSAWSRGRSALRAMPGHRFWMRWYDALLDGRPLTGDWNSHWTLIEQVSRIDEDVWKKGSLSVAEVIEYLENQIRYRTHGSVNNQSPSFSPPVSDLKLGIVANKGSIPATLDALYGHIEMEIRRLQGINDWSFDAAQESAREISARLTRMAAIVQDLKLRIDEIGAEPTIADAEESRRLWQLYVDEIRGWPEENVKEIVDSTWRLGLCGLTGGALTMFGVAAPVAFGAAGVFFGGKKVIDAVKYARSNPKS